MSERVSETYNEDCIAGMKRYPDKYFDLAIVDPDFGLNEKISNGGTWAAKWKKEDGFLGGKPTIDYFTELRRVSKNQIVWGGNYFADMLPASRCWLIWDKIAHMDTLADCELAWTSFDKNSKIFKHPRNTSEARIHICQKPVKLYERILKNYAQCSECGGSGEAASNTIDCDVQTCKYCKGDPFKILDTHLGSQSSRIAAHKGGFDFVGFEIDPDYFRDGNKRFAQYLSQTRLEFPH
jgi:site-specific DNA-methyltransferase (adenine-specific)